MADTSDEPGLSEETRWHLDSMTTHSWIPEQEVFLPVAGIHSTTRLPIEHVQTAE